MRHLRDIRLQVARPATETKRTRRRSVRRQDPQDRGREMGSRNPLPAYLVRRRIKGRDLVREAYSQWRFFSS